jgi:hypothetical protein
MIRRFLCVAVALVALVTTSALFHALFPPLIPAGVAAKLKFFTEHRDEFDTLLVGTSSIYYSISPEIFDRTTRESGLPMHTFNFGIDAMHPLDTVAPRRSCSYLFRLATRHSSTFSSNWSDGVLEYWSIG